MKVSVSSCQIQTQRSKVVSVLTDIFSRDMRVYRSTPPLHTHTHINTYMYTYIPLSLLLCMYVCAFAQYLVPIYLLPLPLGELNSPIPLRSVWSMWLILDQRNMSRINIYLFFAEAFRAGFHVIIISPFFLSLLMWTTMSQLRIIPEF